MDMADEVLDRITTYVVSCYYCMYQGLVQVFEQVPKFCPMCGEQHIGTVLKPVSWLK
jgi:hypothetical protein